MRRLSPYGPWAESLHFSDGATFWCIQEKPISPSIQSRQFNARAGNGAHSLATWLQPKTGRRNMGSTKTLKLLDTSVLIAAFSDAHEVHDEAIPHLIAHSEAPNSSPDRSDRANAAKSSTACSTSPRSTTSTVECM